MASQPKEPQSGQTTQIYTIHDDKFTFVYFNIPLRCSTHLYSIWRRQRTLVCKKNMLFIKKKYCSMLVMYFKSKRYTHRVVLQMKRTFNCAYKNTKHRSRYEWNFFFIYLRTMNSNDEQYIQNRQRHTIFARQFSLYSRKKIAIDTFNKNALEDGFICSIRLFAHPRAYAQIKSREKKRQFRVSCSFVFCVLRNRNNIGTTMAKWQNR